MTPAVAPASNAERAIPYRESAEVSGGDIAGAFGFALLLLATALGLAWFARRRGWLQRWGAAARTAGRPQLSSLRVEQALRISPRTVLFRIADGERTYLLAESRQGIQLLAEPGLEAREEGGNAP